MRVCWCVGGVRVCWCDISHTGYGESTGDISDAAGFLSELLALLKVQSPVIVSPSMSGRLSLPFLTSHPDMVRGFVPVAPVATETYIDKYPSIQVHNPKQDMALCIQTVFERDTLELACQGA